MQEKIQQLVDELTEKFEQISTMQELNDLKAQYQGKKGIITELSAKIKDIPVEEKKEYGMRVNVLREAFNNGFEKIKNRLFLMFVRYSIQISYAKNKCKN